MSISSAKKLNSEQIEAIEHGEGPLLIIAGAGTGKTTVVTERIKHLIAQQNISSANILALTFTEKAALEMEERVDQALPLGYSNLWIYTFHGFCDRILRDEAINIGLDPKYKLMTGAENIQLLRKNLFKFELDYYRPLGNPNKFIEGMLQHFSRLKDEDVEPKQYLEWVETFSFDETPEDKQKYQELAGAYKFYEELKIKEGLMDFGDLMSNVLKIFRSRPNILKKYRDQFKYILVDEFQDTNYAQYVLVKFLAPPPSTNLTVVGDDNQAIYRWRGAAISNILQFKDDYPEAKEVILNKNYRSTQTILDTSYKLIKHNDPDTLEAKLGISKKLQKMSDSEEVPVEFIFENRVEDEAEVVAKEILKLKAENEKLSFKDFAILVRANSHAEPFIRALEREGIACQFLGPGMLFRQPEVKDLIAYLNVLYNFEDSVSMYRLLSMEYFGVEGRDLAELLNISRKKKISLFETCEEVILDESVKISDQTRQTLSKLVKLIHGHMNLVKTETAGQLLYFFLEETGMLRKLASYDKIDDEKKAQNIAKFFEKLKSYETDHEDASVYAVVDFINLSLELGESPLVNDTDWRETEAVNLLTVHSAKGLEFPVVFLVNLVNQRFPTMERKEQIPIPQELIKEILPTGDFHLEEERRLFYVGMTRAKNRLYLTAAKFYGEGKREKKVSPFVLEALREEVLSQSPRQKSQQLAFLSLNEKIVETEKIEKTEKQESPKNPKNISIPINLSYSQIDTFNICPLKYKFRYVLSLPTPSGPALTFGNTIHQTIHDFYQRAIAGQNPNKDDLLQILTENWNSLGYSSKAHEERYKKEGAKILSGFFDKAYDPNKLPLTLEQSFSIRIGGARINGKIDRIDLTEGEVEIIDYKTGKSTTQKEVDKDLQLSLYALVAAEGILTYMGILKETPAPEKVKVSFYFFDTQEKVSTIKKAEDLEKVKEDLIQKIDEISTSCFSPTPGMHCYFCEYKMICDAWK
ncbi:MAG: ATP-dependent helicase [Patescibacteria group bacterium]